MNKIYIINNYFYLEIEVDFINNIFICEGIDYKFKLFEDIIYIYWLENEYEIYYTENSYIYYSDKSLKNKIKLIYLVHDEWFDQAILFENNNFIKRIKYDSEIGTFILENNKLIIFWEKWNKELFIQYDKYTYHISNNLISTTDTSITDTSITDKNINDKNIFLNENIQIFFHICCIENWKEIFIEQINTIKISGLYNIVNKINLCILGNVYIINDEVFKDDKFNIIYIDSRNYLYELLTINSIKSYCENIDNEVFILYIHTKGVRRAGNDNVIKSWRNMMEYFLINNYINCLNGLKYMDYDTLGNNIIDARCVDIEYANVNSNHNLHYSGNFWWSKKSYIDKLDYIQLNLSKTADFTRFKAENWILSNYPNAHIGVIYQDYTNLHPYYKYINDSYKDIKYHIKKYNKT